MIYKEGARVYLANGKEIGRLDRVVIDPLTMQVSEIVIKHGLLSPERKIAAATLIDRIDGDEIHLIEYPGGWNELPDFEEHDYRYMSGENMTYPENLSGSDAQLMYSYPPIIPVSGGGAYPPGAILHGEPATPSPDYASSYVKETRRNTPEGEVALKEGARVVSADGAELGSLERLFTNPENGEVTHFLVSSGMLLKKEKMIPANWVSELHEHEVRLGINARFVEQLPDYEG